MSKCHFVYIIKNISKVNILLSTKIFDNTNAVTFQHNLSKDFFY